MSGASDVFRVVDATPPQEALLEESIGRLDMAGADVAAASALVADSNTAGARAERAGMRARAKYLLRRAEHLIEVTVRDISRLEARAMP
jgi:hypothetical protein